MSSLKRLLTWINPCRTLLARIGIVVLLLSLGVGAVVATVSGQSEGLRSRRRAGRELLGMSGSFSAMIQRWIGDRSGEVRLLGQQISRVSVNDQRQLLQQMQKANSNYLWLALVDAQGKVLVWGGSGQLDVPQEVVRASSSYVGPVRTIALAGKEAMRVLDLGQPVIDSEGGTMGVLWGCLNWDSSEEIRWSVQKSNDKAELMLADEEGTVLSGSQVKRVDADTLRALGRGQWGVSRWGDEKSYVTATSPAGANWLAIAREPVEVVDAEARGAQRMMLMRGLGIGAAFGGLGWLIYMWLMGPLRAVCEVADEIRSGRRDLMLEENGASPETESLTEAMRGLMASLAQRERALRQSELRYRQMFHGLALSSY
jgi:hypothetical protein